MHVSVHPSAGAPRDEAAPTGPQVRPFLSPSRKSQPPTHPPTLSQPAPPDYHTPTTCSISRSPRSQTMKDLTPIGEERTHSTHLQPEEVPAKIVHLPIWKPIVPPPPSPRLHTTPRVPPPSEGTLSTVYRPGGAKCKRWMCASRDWLKLARPNQPNPA